MDNLYMSIVLSVDSDIDGYVSVWGKEYAEGYSLWN